ncbi:MAG: N-6 DNA methylase [Actinomycetota bacterium]|nr:N-6 DNA methylase [Actinomycetota bacterium]
MPNKVSGEEIKRALADFVKRWKDYEGTERAEAQTFLNELFVVYGNPRIDLEGNTVAFFERPQEGGIVDLIYPNHAIVEMKAPSEASHLERHREQALNYWKYSSDPASNRPATPFVVLCAFKRFEVWEPGRYPSGPRETFDISELPDRFESLLFLADEEPLFLAHRKQLTTDAAKRVALLNESLKKRNAASPETIRLFLLQMVWCLFAESLELIHGRPVERIITGLLSDLQRSSASELGYLFDVLNSQDQSLRGGLYSGAPYVNGGLFANPARVHLQHSELLLLAEVVRYDWREVDPTIFGALMEECLGRDRRWELGAHYTHEDDILKIVTPSIIEPWTERINSTKVPSEALGVLEDLCRFKVLDPACGCGNFLYVAYRELRHLEQLAKAKVEELSRSAGVVAPSDLPSYPISNLYGIEIEEFAVMISRVTLWMGHKLVTDTYGLVEPVLPLVDLSGIQQGDALQMEWPEVDVIIGNPPFQGGQHLREALGNDYLRWLVDRFDCGVQDLCVYWFRKAIDHLGEGGRAGLVGTNSISQNKARAASLDYVVANGGVITSAVSSEKWPGDAKVHVSLVNWIKNPTESPKRYVLDDEVVKGITSSLRADEGLPAPVPLRENQGWVFQGPIPVGEGFILTPDEAAALLARKDAHYLDVVRPYLIGEEIANDPNQRPQRWIIDFGSMPLEHAEQYPKALTIVKERVKPLRDRNAMKHRRDYWWQFGSLASELRKAIAGLPRYIAGTATGKRLFLTWCNASWCPSNLTNVFAFDDDYSFGILSSTAHAVWARHTSSTLETRLRYTPSTAFVTFAWPYPVEESDREAVAEFARELFELRRALCAEFNVGLTKLYNTMEMGGHRSLAELHRHLDIAVARCYGWEDTVAQNPTELIRLLSDRNARIASGEEYAPFPKREVEGRLGI